MQVRKLNKLIVNIVFILSYFLSLPNAYGLMSSWQQDKSGNSKVRIVASFFSDQNSRQKLIIGLNFEIKKGWKIYGNDDNSSIGLPPAIDFSNSSNYLNNKIIWPQAILAEEKIADETVKYSYYHDEVIIPIEIDLKDYSQPANLKMKIDYGLCNDICIPANAEFDINLEILENDQKALSLIQKYYQTQITNQVAPISKTSYAALFAALIAAFIGGMILNIMPCVLPVLSIKLISVINHSHATIKRIRLAFLSTIVGIIFCFLIFATITSIAKLAGDNLGWGLQFQNRYFLMFLILILAFFSANLLGLFEIRFSQIMATILNKKISNHLKNEQAESHNKNIFIGNFLSGILAVLLATPCSAPFLGSAISFALAQDIAIIFLIFTIIAIGVATPYILLLIAPRALYLLPKPGKWMVKIKKLMALFLILTIFWLVYVLTTNPALTTNQTSNRAIREDIWIKFDQNQIPILVAQGKTVVVDVTASWCLTCKLNKALVLNDKKVLAKLNNPNIVAMRADITKPDKKVMDFLRANDRFAIPFNAVYGPKIPGGKITSELLKKEGLLQLINQASNIND